MGSLIELYALHPFWAWLTLGAVLLVAEALTGSGWMLWPAASSAVVAVLALTGIARGPLVDVLLFAGLTLAAWRRQLTSAQTRDSTASAAPAASRYTR